MTQQIISTTAHYLIPAWAVQEGDLLVDETGMQFRAVRVITDVRETGGFVAVYYVENERILYRPEAVVRLAQRDYFEPEEDLEEWARELLGL